MVVGAVPSELAPLSLTERRLWEAFPRGVVVAPAPEDRTPVRAEVIRSLLLGAVQAEPGYRAALRLHGVAVLGRLDLYQAEVAVAIELLDCVFDAVPELSFAHLRALDLSGSRLPGLDAFGVTVQGSLDLVRCTLTGAVVVYGAMIGGDLDFDWARLTAGGRPPELFGDRTAAIFGESVQVGRNLYLQGTIVDGTVDLAGTRVSGAVCARTGVRIDGELRLGRAEVGGTVDLTDADLRNSGGVALDGWGLRAGQLTLLPTAVDGTVDLRHARFDVLRDDPARWPAELRLDGATYTALEPVLAAQDRLPWLAGDGYRPQPYEQLAAVYRGSGREADARTVLLARERRRRRHLSTAGRVWGLLQDALVGYGYRPGRAWLWLLALIALGSVVVSLRPPTQRAGGPAFNPVIYTVDLLIPIVDFGQERAFDVNGPAGWLAYGLTAMGWILFTAVAAAVGRAVNR
jgi:hypothetical protein